MKRIHIIVKGNVQGVFFRANTKDIAIKLGLKGYVKNLPDGSVEIVAEGEKVNELIEFCKKGTEYAKVEDVVVKVGKHKNEFENFEIRY